MKQDDVIKYIQSMLGNIGDSGVDVELDVADFNSIVAQALSKLAPYYSGKRYVVADTPVVDLSIHDPVTISCIWDTSQSVLLSAEDFALGGQNIIIYNADFRDRYVSYTAYKMLYNEYRYLKAQSWKYIDKTLYIHGFNKQTLIELVVRPRVISDIEDSSQWCSWVKDYCLALAKEVVGRKRSKYTVEGSPYKLDGNTLLSESAQEKQELEAQLVGDIFVI